MKEDADCRGKARSMNQCEFCQELQGLPGNRFGAMYAGIAASRIVAQTEHFVVLPTIGQLCAGSLLILPRVHKETCAELQRTQQEGLAAILKRVTTTIRQFGWPVFFEHGAKCHTGGSCGIYHAHLHVVPLPALVEPRELFPEHVKAATSIQDALEALKDSEHYLLIGSEDGVVFASVDSLPSAPVSQHFRRRLRYRFSLSKHWDWRETAGPESELLATVSAFGGEHVSDWAGNSA